MRRKARIDTTATALVQVAKQCMAKWLPWPGGPVDGFLHKDTLWMIDWKSPGGRKTETQERLVDEGWPIQFIETPEEVINLLYRDVPHV